MRKVKAAVIRRFKPDSFCRRPEYSGTWFTTFDEPSHVTTTADYKPGLPVHLAVDPGVYSWTIEVRLRPRVASRSHVVTVLAEGLCSEATAV